MSNNQSDANLRGSVDPELQAIADYVCDVTNFSDEAYETAWHCLWDSLGCAMLALDFDACTRHLGPVITGTSVPNGVPIPGTPHQLDPVKAAFDIGATIRWLDFNDTWLAAEWGHPSDNLGAILAAADFSSRYLGQQWSIRDVLTALIQAYEIQGVLALENCFNRLGFDHVVLVKIASAAVAARLMGASRQQVLDTLGHAFVDGQSLRTYRHAPNATSRKSWAAGDATSRAVRLAMMVLAGESGLTTPLSVSKWGFQDVLMKGNSLQLSQPFGSYVVENILFKISFPAEFHAQTAVECALQVHDDVKDRIDDIERIEVATQESAVRIISKTGPLYNPADRDHCLQYMIAVPLLFGRLSAADYEDDVASDPRIDTLRSKMVVSEDKQYSIDYLDPNQRAIPNAVQVFFNDGTSTDRVEVKFPIGHRMRRAEGVPLLIEKVNKAIDQLFSSDHAPKLIDLRQDRQNTMAMSLTSFLDQWQRN
ncbi:MAG: 2-methylcitrate dehydratase [Planctomycetaceae bacterium]|nr:2-methylcitrate dehydratase [Planctomycetaceae bacterium]